MSRAYQEIDPGDTLEEELEIHMVLPISNDKLKQLQSETQKYPVLQKRKNVILNSWPRYKSNLHPTVQVYWDYQEELTIHNELIFKRDKVVIPPALRADMLKAVHQPHLGGEAANDELVKFCFGLQSTGTSRKWLNRVAFAIETVTHYQKYGTRWRRTCAL